MEKPYPERLIDAGCIFFEVEREFFSRKTKESTDKKAALFYLLKHEGEMGLREISRMFDHDVKSVFEAVEKVEVWKNIYPTKHQQLKSIVKIAGNLKADMVCVDIKLVNIHVDN